MPLVAICPLVDVDNNADSLVVIDVKFWILGDFSYEKDTYVALIVMVVKVIKAENGEGGREASEASKTSEVKAEAKVEDTTKGETVLVDEDLRKLFVGGLAQVSMPVQFNR